MEWVLPKSITAVDAALQQYLPGKADGWCEFELQQVGPSKLIYRLRQYELGEFATITLYALSEQVTRMRIAVLRLPPLASEPMTLDDFNAQRAQRQELLAQREAHLRNVIKYVLYGMQIDDEDLKLAQLAETSAGDRQRGTRVDQTTVTLLASNTTIERVAAFIWDFSAEYQLADHQVGAQKPIGGDGTLFDLYFYLRHALTDEEKIAHGRPPHVQNAETFDNQKCGTIRIKAGIVIGQVVLECNPLTDAAKQFVDALADRLRADQQDAQPAEPSAGVSDAKLDRLLTGQDELKRGQADLKRGQTAIYQRLTQAQRETVDEVLAGVRAMRIDDAQTLNEMRGMLDGLRRALIDLRARELPQMSASLRQSIDEVTEVLKADADVNTGLELTIPLIPLLLDYKFDLDLGGGLDLRQWWENLWRKLHRGD